MKAEDLITEEELINAFGYADFGKGITKRDFVNENLKNQKDGYHTGHTIYCILKELGLSNGSNQLTVMGEKYLKLIK